MTAATIARSAAGPDPRKPLLPEIGVARLVTINGNEIVLVTAVNAQGHCDKQEYFITLQQIADLAGGGSSEITPHTNNNEGDPLTVTKLTQAAGDDELDLVCSGASGTWLYTADGTGSAPAGIGSGNASEFTSGTLDVYTGEAHGDSGQIGIASGNSSNGNSGNIPITTGNSATGNSGDIALTTGTADGQRGKIILDARNITAPAGFVLDAQASPFTVTIPGQTADNGAGADIDLTAGPGGNTSGDGGKITLLTGVAGNGVSGDFYAASQSNPNGSGTAGIESGDTQAGTGNSGVAFLGSSDAGGKSGNTSIYTGKSNGADQDAGSIVIACGSATNGNANGGDIHLNTGNGVGTGRSGLVTISNLPTADPHVVGALWNSSGALHVSAG